MMQFVCLIVTHLYCLVTYILKSKLPKYEKAMENNSMLLYGSYFGNNGFVNIVRK